MARRVFIILLIIIAAACGAASAEITNYELQLSGGLVAVNSSDTFFFTPKEEGGWELYSVSTYANGPIATIKDVVPSRLFYADSGAVYFLGIRPDNGYIFASVDIKTGQASPIIDKLESTAAESETTFFYVMPEDRYTLYRYNILEKKSTKIKSLTSKTMYDAALHNKALYLLGADSAGALTGYELNTRSGKAVNMSSPNPKVGDGFYYDGYLVYNQKGDTTKIYAAPISKTKGVRLGEKVSGLNLYSPRYAGALYTLDTSQNSLVRVPVDGSAPFSLPLISQGSKSVILGGTSDGLYYWDDGSVYAVSTLLQNKTELFEFDNHTDNMVWTTFAPTKNNHLLVMGYIPFTLADEGKSVPTAVRLVDLSTREAVFRYPAAVEAAIEDPDDPNYVAPAEYADTSASTEPTVYEDLLVGENEDVSFEDVFGY